MQTARTTVNLPAPLLHQAKVYAAQNQKTLTELIKEGLEKTLGITVTQQNDDAFVEYLKNFTPSVPPLTLEEQDKRYREAMIKKHG
jgi:hypothetical protein